MVELELTYLVKYLPANLTDLPSKEVIDIYFPKNEDHPKLRLRKSGDSYEITKKQPVKEDDASNQIEQTIVLNKAEYEQLVKIEGKKVHKIRYYYPFKERAAEIDVFQGELSGLIVVDFEFDSLEEKSSFAMPEFCLADITQEKFIAGGKICGKSYQDIATELDRFGYKKIHIQ